MQSKLWRWISALSFILLCAQGYAATTDQNTVKSITATASGDIEVVVTSSREFPVRDQLVYLTIGGQQFSRSRSPADGSLNTLIFILPSDAYSRMAGGEPMSVQFGEGRFAGDRWDFGTLNKGMLLK